MKAILVEVIDGDDDLLPLIGKIIDVEADIDDEDGLIYEIEVVGEYGELKHIGLYEQEIILLEKWQMPIIDNYESTHC